MRGGVNDDDDDGEPIFMEAAAFSEKLAMLPVLTPSQQQLATMFGVLMVAMEAPVPDWETIEIVASTGMDWAHREKLSCMTRILARIFVEVSIARREKSLFDCVSDAANTTPAVNAAYVFQFVAPRQWIGTLGVAAAVVGRSASVIGSVHGVPRTGAVEFMRTDKICSACGDLGTFLCSGCRAVFYCCADHQLADWDRHRDACARFANKDQSRWSLHPLDRTIPAYGTLRLRRVSDEDDAE